MAKACFYSSSKCIPCNKQECTGQPILFDLTLLMSCMLAGHLATYSCMLCKLIILMNMYLLESKRYWKINRHFGSGFYDLLVHYKALRIL